MFFRNGIRNVANASILVEKLGDAVDAKNARVEKYVRSGRTRTAAVLLRQVLQLQESQVRIMRGLRPGDREEVSKGEERANPVFLASSLFLADCYQYLVRGEPEWMHAVTGIQFGACRTLERFVHFTNDEQSALGVKANVSSVFKALTALDECGHGLHGIFHSHRFSGIPRPSSVDLALQERLDAGGYGAVQCIFSEDGFLTFFAGSRNFEVKIHGKIKQLSRRVFRLGHKT